MKRDDAIRLLRRHAAELRELGVAHAQLFGSIARDEARPDSDVDVFVTHIGGGFSWFSLFPVKTYLQKLFGHEVDVFTLDGLNYAPRTKERVQPELIDVF